MSLSCLIYLLHVEIEGVVNNLLCVTEYHEAMPGGNYIQKWWGISTGVRLIASIIVCFLRFGISLRKVVGPLPYVRALLVPVVLEVSTVVVRM